MLAAIALVDVAAEPAGSAGGHCTHDSVLGDRRHQAGDVSGGIPERGDDVGHLQRWPGHGRLAGLADDVERTLGRGDLLTRDVHVGAGGREASVTEEALDDAHVDAGLEHVGGAGVA